MGDGPRFLRTDRVAPAVVLALAVVNLALTAARMARGPGEPAAESRTDRSSTTPAAAPSALREPIHPVAEPHESVAPGSRVVETDAPCGSAPDPTKVVVSTDGRTRVWVSHGICVSVKGGAPHLLVEERASELGPVEFNLTGFDGLRFSSDERTLYFTTDAWATSPALHAADLRTGRQSFLTDGWLEAEVDQGPYKGMLLVRHFLLDPEHEVNSPAYRGRMMMRWVHTRYGELVSKTPEEKQGTSGALD